MPGLGPKELRELGVGKTLPRVKKKKKEEDESEMKKHSTCINFHCFRAKAHTIWQNADIQKKEDNERYKRSAWRNPRVGSVGLVRRG